MGWLYQQANSFFSVNDGSNPEICICPLPRQAVISAFRMIRQNSGRSVGSPVFFSIADNSEILLDEVECAATMVCDGLAQPFHFIARDIRFSRDNHIRELGVFIMPNAVALDYETGPLWGELEIESILLLILVITKGLQNVSICLEEHIAEAERNRFNEILKNLSDEFDELPHLAGDLRSEEC